MAHAASGLGLFLGLLYLNVGVKAETLLASGLDKNCFVTKNFHNARRTKLTPVDSLLPLKRAKAYFHQITSEIEQHSCAYHRNYLICPFECPTGFDQKQIDPVLRLISRHNIAISIKAYAFGERYFSYIDGRFQEQTDKAIRTFWQAPLALSKSPLESGRLVLINDSLSIINASQRQADGFVCPLHPQMVKVAQGAKVMRKKLTVIQQGLERLSLGSHLTRQSRNTDNVRELRANLNYFENISKFNTLAILSNFQNVDHNIFSLNKFNYEESLLFFSLQEKINGEAKINIVENHWNALVQHLEHTLGFWQNLIYFFKELAWQIEKGTPVLCSTPTLTILEVECLILHTLVAKQIKNELALLGTGFNVSLETTSMRTCLPQPQHQSQELLISVNHLTYTSQQPPTKEVRPVRPGDALVPDSTNPIFAVFDQDNFALACPNPRFLKINGIHMRCSMDAVNFRELPLHTLEDEDGQSLLAHKSIPSFLNETLQPSWTDFINLGVRLPNLSHTEGQLGQLDSTWKTPLAQDTINILTLVMGSLLFVVFLAFIIWACFKCAMTFDLCRRTWCHSSSLRSSSQDSGPFDVPTLYRRNLPQAESNF